MPWHIEHNVAGCGGWVVLKDADNSVAGCHPTKEDAKAQLAALYASESEMETESE